MYLVINKCVTAVKVSKFSGHYLRNRSTLGIGVLGYIGIVQHKEHSPEVCPFLLGHPVYCYRIKEVCIKLVALKILYYDARSEKHKKTSECLNVYFHQLMHLFISIREQ